MGGGKAPIRQPFCSCSLGTRFPLLHTDERTHRARPPLAPTVIGDFRWQSFRLETRLKIRIIKERSPLVKRGLSAHAITNARAKGIQGSTNRKTVRRIAHLERRSEQSAIKTAIE